MRKMLIFSRFLIEMGGGKNPLKSWAYTAGKEAV